MSIGFLILFLAIIPALWKRSGLFSILWLLGSGIIAFEYLEVIYSRTVQDFMISFPYPIGTANIGISKLSAFFGTVFAIGLPLGMLYGHFYLKQHPSEGIRSHLFWLGILGLSMHGILWMKHSLLFLMVWELMSISSFFCVIHDRQQSLKAGLNYIITMQIGAAFLMVGFGLMFIHTGSFDFNGLENMPRLPMYLLLIGFAFKAGFVPLASWLPQAHPVAPAHVSGMMSGLMIKAGLYGIILILLTNAFSLWEILFFCLLSIISAFWGVIHSMVSTNIKKVLAYSSIENIGIIGIGLCVGLLGKDAGIPAMATLGFAGAFLHIFFHSMFKALLFYLSGNVLVASHTLEIDKLGGLAKSMPFTAVYFLVGTIAISALPLGNGFISEFTILYGIFHAMGANDLPAMVFGAVLLSVLAFVGALALIAFSKLFAIIFLGEARQEEARNAQECPRGMRIPQLVLGLGILATGGIANLGLRFVKPILRWMALDMTMIRDFQTTLNQVSIVLAIVVLLSALLYLIRRMCVRESISATWGCGYQKPNPRMQYGSYAFVHPLSYFLKPFILFSKKQKQGDMAKGINPINSMEAVDPIFKYIVEPVSNAMSWFFELFSHIHNGKTNSYIAWCLGFLILIIIWVLGVR